MSNRKSIDLEEISKKSSEEEKIDQLKHCFTLIISADYQMRKSVPYWAIVLNLAAHIISKSSLMIYLELLITERTQQFTCLMNGLAQKQQTIQYPISFTTSNLLVKYLPW